MKVMVETSAHHVHVTKETLEALFGKGATLKRHIHLDPKTAEEFGLKDKQLVSVKVGENTGRATTFGDVVIRVNANYAPAMHIDTDESNAAGLGGTVDGEIIA